MFEELTDLAELRPGASPGWPESDNTAVFAHSRYYFDPASRALFVLVRFDAQAEGQAGVVHGGAISWVVDQAMGGVSWLVGHTAATARLEVKYRRPAPMGVEFLATSRVTRHAGRRVWAECLIRDGNGVVYTTSSALLMKVGNLARREPTDAARQEIF